jgi:hypothetical protein
MLELSRLITFFPEVKLKKTITKLKAVKKIDEPYLSKALLASIVKVRVISL